MPLETTARPPLRQRGQPRALSRSPDRDDSSTARQGEPQQPTDSNFNRNLRAWYTQVAADPDVTHFKLLIAYVLGNHFNSISGLAWPTQQTMARLACGTPQGVQKAVDWLLRGGHLKSTKIGRRNEYEMVLQKTNGRLPFIGQGTSSRVEGTHKPPSIKHANHQIKETPTAVCLEPEVNSNDSEGAPPTAVAPAPWPAESQSEWRVRSTSARPDSEDIPEQDKPDFDPSEF